MKLKIMMKDHLKPVHTEKEILLKLEKDFSKKKIHWREFVKFFNLILKIGNLSLSSEASI